MHIDLTGHHIEITDAIRDYTHNKFQRLERHFSAINKAQIILSVEKLNQSAEANLTVTGGTIFANASGADMYAVIDALVNKLDRQLIKHKEKLHKH